MLLFNYNAKGEVIQTIHKLCNSVDTDNDNKLNEIKLNR